MMAVCAETENEKGKCSCVCFIEWEHRLKQLNKEVLRIVAITCCWEKPLPWLCWYSFYCTWLHWPCTRTWYVKCYKFVCMLFFKLLQYVYTFVVSCAFIPQTCTWRVYTCKKYQESSPRFNIWGDCTTHVKLFNCQTLNYQSQQVFLNSS
jgi:hypothetical protein